MVSIPGYDVSKELYNGSRTLVYRADREADRKPVVIKLMKSAYPSFNELVQFRNQFTIAKNLNLPGIIQTYSLEPYQNGYALVMEDFGGISLKEWGVGRSVESLMEFLRIAIALCNTLDILIRHRIIHKDIKPANILINPETKEVKLIDFSIASLLPRETQVLMSPNVLEGTLGYLSPEQTGRMNRGIDYRTDFYSLGVTFYELLTGELPFKSHDAMELVHCHIAKLPPLVHEINPQIPPVLSSIVSKLMAKNAEDRYQSAFGLKYDLENCLAQLNKTGKIASFPIAQRDVCDRFIIPEKLYGREHEVETLLKAFDRVTNNQTELMLVAGFSGIGKTALVNEIHKPIVRQRGYFIKGKYDQFNRNIPFSAFVQAFRDLMGQLVNESDVQLSTWKNKILQVLGDQGQVILEVIPELEQIIGQQPPATELSPSAAQNRFNLLFQKFIQVFTTKEHPLVIFLDDLQWVDSASLKLMQLLMNQSGSGSLLLIGAYRDNEVSTAHPLTLTLTDIRKANATIHSITLAPLSKASLNQLLVDTLSCSVEAAQPLTRLIYQKTQGNPFFITQFLKALYEEGLITFNFQQGYWQCDIAGVKTLALTDDVVEFVALQLQKLPAATQNVLKLAACIGNQFDLLTLAIVSEQSETETAASLWKALQEGLILPTSEVYKFFQDSGHDSDSNPFNSNFQVPTYKFLHDRVQQAAYSLIPGEQKQFTHLKIGQLLLQNTSESQQEERIFEIVSQLNRGILLITQPIERQKLAQLNLNAGRKAKEATAYGAAIHYLNSGMELLTINSWEIAYELTLSLYEEAAEAAFLSNQFELMEFLIQIVIQQTTTLLDRVKVYEVQLQAYQVQGQPFQAIAAGRELLNQLGVTLPESVTPLDIQQYVVNTLSTLAGRSIESLVDLPLMDDAKALVALRIIASIAPAIHQSSSNLLPIIACEEVNLSLKYGNAPLSAPGYADFGIVLNSCNQLESGYEFGKLGLMLVDKFQAKSVQSMTIFKVAALNQCNKQHVRTSISLLQESHNIGLETGDFFHVLSSMIFKLFYVYLSGTEVLEILLTDIKAYQSNFAKNQRLLNWSNIICQSIKNLTEYSNNPECLIGEYCQEEQLLSTLIKENDELTLHIFFLNKLTLSYLFENFPAAVENANQGEQYLNDGTGMLSVPVFYYYDSLSRLAVYPTAEPPQQEQLLLKVSENQEKLQFRAKFAPMNFQHKFDLVEAERYRVLGEKMAAMELYDRAISLAKENEYIQEEALGNELAAKFYLDWGKEKIAQAYMQEAYYCYARWGAQAKTEDLEKRYPQLLAPILQGQLNRFQLSSTVDASSFPHQTIHTNLSSSSISEALDFDAIFKASQALSSEIKLEKLLTTLLQVVMENAGAQKAALLILQQDNLVVEAVATINEGVTLVSVPLSTSQNIPITLVNSVKRTLKTVVLDDATAQTDFIADSYFMQQQPKSVLCTPMLNQGKLIGLLYLENPLTIGAFTSDRTEVIQLLCTQAAISLDNARLYQESQNYAHQLERSLAQLRASEARFQKVADNIPGAIYQLRLNPDGSVSMPYISSGCYKLYEVKAEEIMAGTQNLRSLEHPDDFASIQQAIIYSAENITPFRHKWRIITPSGTMKWIQGASQPERQADGSIVWDGVVIDISEGKLAEAALQESEAHLRHKSQDLEEAVQNFQQAQLQMVQNEKMATLGNLVAGVAHEINNPIGFLKGSVNNAEEYIQDLLAHIQCYQEHHPTPAIAVIEHGQEIDLEFLAEDLPKLVSSMKVASERIKDISISLRTFSRADTTEKVACNIHEGIESTLLILKYRLKANEKRPAIKVITEYGELPPVKCFLGQLNQVFMNIIANAIDALDTSTEGCSFAQVQANHQQILIRTEVSSDQRTVAIRIRDNGQGMLEEVRTRIFDHLFTTKEVGKGTGLGLAIARQIVEETHDGRLSCNSVLGEGTEFVIEIPVS
ncbi:multi-sensor signal transduction multi-kinase [Nostoc commune NIES-4072]|uniref:histidine kinase n=1 Tax=Nostoc commune NIES-4072 TaxID=2005467 RepID=A0A2R5G1M0_NOSCO|nr:ATP-binding sensor histidine kinase [Nostoc commune]BBD66645.1 multi-sensor signal transduction multi-kinase [Nostoc commune HK-02]GBG22373.1 multi-sensor signal transduction multi-kinase [Nostoc commune NIES-4072]